MGGIGRPGARHRAGRLLATLVVAIGLYSVIGVRSTAPRARLDSADLRITRPMLVSGGSVTGSRGWLRGSFIVRNATRTVRTRQGASLTLMAGKRSHRVANYRIARLGASGSLTVRVRAAIPAPLAAGPWAIVACAGSSRRGVAPGCRTIGHLRWTVISQPVRYTVDRPQEIRSAQSDLWVDVPRAYDSSGQTPMKLLVWLHGCGGHASDAIDNIVRGARRDYLAIAVGGREGRCWDVNADVPKVLAAVADAETHFNIDPHQVILGGYSSGGDLGYRTIFDHANRFAGLLAENTSPFRDTGATAAQSLAAASRKFPVIHLAHLQDATYPIAGVRNEVSIMQRAGFPVLLMTLPGDHYDDAGASGYRGTVPDLQTYLLSHIDDGWRAPAGG